MLAILHFIAIIAVFINALTMLYKMILTVFILISLFFYIKKEFNFRGLTLRHAASCGWEIAFLEKEFSLIQILPSTVITHYLIVLHYKTQKHKKRAIIVCKDAMTNDNFRKLLVALKISGFSQNDT